jgi:hypothetical protein
LEVIGVLIGFMGEKKEEEEEGVLASSHKYQGRRG